MRTVNQRAKGTTLIIVILLYVFFSIKLLLFYAFFKWTQNGKRNYAGRSGTAGYKKSPQYYNR